MSLDHLSPHQESVGLKAEQEKVVFKIITQRPEWSYALHSVSLISNTGILGPSALQLSPPLPYEREEMNL